MSIDERWQKCITQLPAIWDAIKQLSVWIFGSFLLPIVQLLFILLSKKTSEVNLSMYNIVFVTIASFLTSVFFVTSFWKQNRMLVRMLLVLSYLISFGLFIVSMVQILHGIEVFDIDVYMWGALIALTFAVLVGFYSKYDENLAISREIASQAKNTKKSKVNGKEVNV